MRNKQSLRPPLNRRDFLKLSAAAGAVAVGAGVLYEAAPWLDPEAKVEQTWRLAAVNLDKPAQLRELVRNATLAASGHNLQPWKFALRESSIEIHPDYTLRLSVVDPNDRELWISLGCALENLLISAKAAGYAGAVTYPGAADHIHVRLEADSPQSSALFEAIPLRQNTRSEYNGRLIVREDLKQVQALPLEQGVRLSFALNPSDMETVLEYVTQGTLIQYAEKAFVDELIGCLRFNKKEALASLDGLYSRCSGSPEAPGWLGRMFVAGARPEQQADADARKFRSSPTVIVIASEADKRKPGFAPGRSTSAWPSS
jgi:hypothetical protein